METEDKDIFVLTEIELLNVSFGILQASNFKKRCMYKPDFCHISSIRGHSCLAGDHFFENILAKGKKKYIYIFSGSALSDSQVINVSELLIAGWISIQG